MQNPIGIFLLGGPGSGKDYVLKNIFSRFDLTEVQADRLLNGSATRLIKEQKNLVINGVIDGEKIAIIQKSLVDHGYSCDTVHVHVNEKVSRLRNEQREHPISEERRAEKYAKAENLAQLKEAFVFNNSINLDESSELERVFFGSQIEKLLEHLISLGLQMNEELPKKLRRAPVTGNKTAVLAARARHRIQEAIKKPTGNLKDACWPGYTAVGLKKKGGRTVPNCVPVDEDINVLFEMQLDGTDEYRDHALAVTPGQSIQDAFPIKTPSDRPIAVVAKAGKSIVSQYTQKEIRENTVVNLDPELIPDRPNRLGRRRGQIVPKNSTSGGLDGYSIAASPLLNTSESITSPKSFRSIRNNLLEYLNPGQLREYSPIEIDSDARKASDHYFGEGNDKIEYKFDHPDLVQKSEVHKEIERHIGQPISPEDYQAGHGVDKYGRKVRLSKLIPDRPELVQKFANDHTRRGAKALGGMTISVHRGVQVAGQTNSEPNELHPEGHPWKSCKDVNPKDRGAHSDSVVDEIRAGSVVVFAHDHTGKEVSRATLHPHVSDNNDRIWTVNSVYGNAHPAFVQEAHRVAKRLSAPAPKGDRLYHIDDSVYNDTYARAQLHPDVSAEELHDEISESPDVATREAVANHPNLQKKTITKMLKDEPSYSVRAGLARRPDLDHSHVKTLAKNLGGGVGSALANNLSLKPKDVTHLINTADASSLMHALSSRTDLTDDHYDHIINRLQKNHDMFHSSLSNLASNRNLPEKHIPTIISHITKAPEWQKRRLLDEIETHPKIKPEHLEQIKAARQTSTGGLSEDVQYHIQNNISLVENVFRPGSDKFFDMISEAKRLYKENEYTPKDEWERDMLESDIGERAIFEGREVILDYPFEEELNEEDKTGGKGIGKPWREGGGGAVYVRTGDGGVKKVSFSKSGMAKKFNDPARVRSFVARHRCLTNKDKTTASYWACRWPRFFSNSGKIWW